MDRQRDPIAIPSNHPFGARETNGVYYSIRMEECEKCVSEDVAFRWKLIPTLHVIIINN